MTGYQVRSKIISNRSEARQKAAALCCAAILMAGCAATKKRPTIPWSTAVLIKPTGLLQSAAAEDLGGDPVPDLQPEVPAFPLQLIPEKSAVRPRVAVSSPSVGRETAKPEAAPVIAPQLSPRESVEAQMQTGDSVSAAERNLASVRGKNLNAAQSDLVSKIEGFLKDARDAAKAGDWVRARSLAKKAQVLSEELVGSS